MRRARLASSRRTLPSACGCCSSAPALPLRRGAQRGRGAQGGSVAAPGQEHVLIPREHRELRAVRRPGGEGAALGRQATVERDLEAGDPRGPVRLTANGSFGSRCQVSGCPLARIVMPTSVSSGPLGMCSPGSHLGNTSVSGPLFTASVRSVCTWLRTISRASRRTVRSAAWASAHVIARAAVAVLNATLILCPSALTNRVRDVPRNGAARQRVLPYAHE